jgi:predicted phosphodiesterase
MDELLTNSGNRSEAFIFAIQVMSKFILDIAEDYHVSVLSVYGNESRLDFDIPNSTPTNNWDFTIHKTLSMILSEYQDRIVFIELSKNWERVVNILGANVLFTHGHTKLTREKAIVKYSQVGVAIHYMITGHIHSTDIKESSFRSGSTVGSNFYSTFTLNLMGRASQNLYILEKEHYKEIPSVTAIAIDLQNTQGIEGYIFDRDVCVNGMRKSVKKGKDHRVIVQVVV